MNGRLDSNKWLVILAPPLCAAVFLAVVYFASPAIFASPIAYGWVALAMLIAALAFSNFIWNTLSQRARELSAHTRIVEAVSASLDLHEILANALDALLELTHAAAGRVWLLDSDTNVLSNTVHRGLFPDAFEKPAMLQLGEDLAGRAAQSTHVEYNTDATRMSNGALLRDKGFVEFASIPLIARKRVVGVVDIAARHRGELGAATQELLRSIGSEIGLAIENARLFETVRARQADAENLYKTGIDVSSKLKLAEVLKTVTERGRVLLEADASALCLWDTQNRWLVVGSENGPADAFESETRIGRRVAQRINLLRVDAEHHADCVTCALIRPPYQQYHIEMPLRVDAQVIGCLCVASARPRTFSDREIHLLGGLVDQAAMAIRNARALDQAGNAGIVLERERLAREMHDTLAQVLGFVNTKSQAVRELLDTGRLDAAREQIDHLAALSLELSADVREVILGLRSALSPSKSLLPTLGDYVQAYSKQSHIDVQMIVEDGARELSFAPAVELQLIRIVQESLTNIRKHAQAQHAVVRFATLDGSAEMRIEDDGRGFDPSRIARGDWPQFGLQTMRERAESIGGAFVLVSKPNQGTQIVVQIPLRYAGVR